MNFKGETQISKSYNEVTISCSLKDLGTQFNTDLVSYRQHCFIAYHQYKALDTIQKNRKRNECFLTCDWSQNYLCKRHKDIQVMHFVQNQRHVALHTGGYYVSDSEGK